MGSFLPYRISAKPLLVLLVMSGLFGPWERTVEAQQGFASAGSIRSARVRPGITCLNLRRAPDPSATVLSCLGPGTKLAVLESSQGWSRVLLEDEREGWLASDYLEEEAENELETALAGKNRSEAPRGGELVGGSVGSSPLAADELAERTEAALAQEAEAARELRDLQANVELLRELLGEYRSREADLLSQRQALQNSVVEMRREVEAARQDKEALERQEDELIRSVASARESVVDLRSQLNEKKAQEGELRERLEQAENRISPLANGALSARTARVLPTISCLNLRVDATTSSSAVACLEPGTRVSVTASREEWSGVRLADGTEGWVASQYLEASPAASVSSAIVERGEEATRVEGLRAREADLRRQISKVESGIEDLQERLSAKRGVEQDLKAELVASEQTTVRLRERLATTEGERLELESRVAAVDSGIDELQQQIAENEARKSELMAKVAKADEEARKELETQVAIAAEARQVPGRKVSEAEESVEDLQASLAAATAQEAELLRQLEETKRENQELAPALQAALGRQQQLGERLASPAERAAAIDAPSDEEAATQDLIEPEMARPESVEPLAQEETVRRPLVSQLPARVEAWAAAWSRQRVEDYLDFYARGVSPAGGLSRTDWEAQRRLRLTRPRFIDIRLGPVEVSSQGEGQASARFTQVYESDTFSDEVIKRLDFVLDEGEWKIVRETVEKVLNGP